MPARSIAISSRSICATSRKSGRAGNLGRTPKTQRAQPTGCARVSGALCVLTWQSASEPREPLRMRLAPEPSRPASPSPYDDDAGRGGAHAARHGVPCDERSAWSAPAPVRPSALPAAAALPSAAAPSRLAAAAEQVANWCRQRELRAPLQRSTALST